MTGTTTMAAGTYPRSAGNTVEIPSAPQVQYDIYEQAKDQFGREGIEIPFPYTNVVLKKEQQGDQLLRFKKEGIGEVKLETKGDR